jgi:hypothetical protein
VPLAPDTTLLRLARQARWPQATCRSASKRRRTSSYRRPPRVQLLVNWTVALPAVLATTTACHASPPISLQAYCGQVSRSTATAVPTFRSSPTCSPGWLVGSSGEAAHSVAGLAAAGCVWLRLALRLACGAGGAGGPPVSRLYGSSAALSASSYARCSAAAREPALESAADYPFNLTHWSDRQPPPCRLDASKILPGSTFSNKTSVPRSAGEEQLAAFVYHNGPMQVGISSHVLRGVARAGAAAFVPRANCANLTGARGIDHSLGVVGFGTSPTHGVDWILVTPQRADSSPLSPLVL